MAFVTLMGDALQPGGGGRRDTGTQGAVVAARRLAMPEAQKKDQFVDNMGTVTFDDVATDKAAFSSAGNVGVDGRIAGKQMLNRPSDVGMLVAGDVGGSVDNSGTWQFATGNKVMMTDNLLAADRNSGVLDFTFSLIDEASKANVADAGGGFNGLYWKSLPPAAARERSGGERRNWMAALILI